MDRPGLPHDNRRHDPGVRMTKPDGAPGRASPDERIHPPYKIATLVAAAAQEGRASLPGPAHPTAAVSAAPPAATTVPAAVSYTHLTLPTSDLV